MCIRHMVAMQAEVGVTGDIDEKQSDELHTPVQQFIVPYCSIGCTRRSIFVLLTHANC